MVQAAGCVLDLWLRYAPSSELAVLVRHGVSYKARTTMRKSVVLGVFMAFVTSGALAQSGSQSPPPAQKGPQNNAINSSDKQVNAPVEGRNSFTEGEAKSKIEKAGFSNVSGLKKDDSGIWRGKAMKNGQSVDVSLDYQGNVVTR